MRVNRGLAATALLLAGLLVGALAAELGLRIFTRVGGELGRSLQAHDPLRVLIEPMGPVGYRHRPHAVQRYANGATAHSNSLGFRGPDIARDKPPGSVRVVLLGGSTTHGWGVNDDETIAAHLQRTLNARAPGRRFEVINAALDGYDSYQILERLRLDVMPLQPDVVVINSGINDVRSARFQNIVDGDPRTLLWNEVLARLRLEQVEGPLLWSRAKHHSLLIRLPGFLLLRMASGNSGGGEASRDSTPADSVPLTWDAADYFERNIRRAAGLARNASALVVLSTPPSALRLNYVATDRSSKNYWLENAERTAVYRDTLAQRLRGLADSLSREGTPVPYLRSELPASMFLDDAHLSSEGNRLVAEAFADAVLRLLPADR